MFRRKKLEADEILISMQDFYELNLTIFWKGILGETKRFLLIIYLDTRTKDWKRIMAVYRLHGDLLARRGGLVPKRKNSKNGWKLGNNETH